MPIYHYQVENRIIKEQSEFVFKELSDGVYLTLKSIPWNLDEFVGAETIVSILQNGNKVYVVGKNTTYCNFEVCGYGTIFMNKPIQ